MSGLRTSVRPMVKIDVEAVGKMLDDLLAPVVRSPYEDVEPEYEFMQIWAAPSIDS